MASKTVTRGVWGTRWRVEKELLDTAGLAFVRRYLSLFDYSQLEWITLRRSLRPYFGYSLWRPIFGKCWYPHATSSGMFRINCNVLDVLARARYPAEVRFDGKLQPYFVNDENEAVVAILAHEVNHFLCSTGQIPANGRVHSGDLQPTSEFEAEEFMKAAVEAYRRRDDELPGTLARAGWCVVCGKPLSKGGGSQSFCCGRCRSTYHNRLRGARIAARRGEQVCAVCGKAFTASRADAKTCSKACRQKKYRQDRNDRSNPGHDLRRHDHQHADGPGDEDHPQDRA